MTVRAKFSVQSIERIQHTLSVRDPDTGRVTYVPSEAQTIKLNAVYGGTTPENEKFFAATPNGQISLTIVRKEVGDTFGLGQEFYVDFTPVVQSPALPSN